MADRLVADVMVERLKAWGVNRVFGYSGDGINGFMGALRRSTEGRSTGRLPRITAEPTAPTREPASNSSRPGTRKRRRSWPSGTPNTPARWAW
jgi:hypothetical protein